MSTPVAPEWAARLMVRVRRVCPWLLPGPGQPREAFPQGLGLVLLAVFLGTAVLMVYWPVLGHDFVLYDDTESVIANPLVQGGLTWDGLLQALRAPYAGFWIPATWVSYMLDVEFLGLEPGGFHATNVVLHGGNTVLLLVFLWRLTGSLWRSGLATALFALHPLRVESVAWVAQRKDLLAGGFCLASLLAYTAYARQGGRLRYFVVVLMLGLGMLSKPVLVGVPLVLLLLDFWPLRRNSVQPEDGPSSGSLRRWQRLFLEKLPLFALSALFSVVALAVHGDAIVPLEGFPLLRRLDLASSSYFVYLRRMFWPSGLALVTADFSPIANVWRLAAAVSGLVVISVAVSRWAGRARFLFVGWFWYLVLLFPMSGLFPSGIWSTADRFTYLPHVGICLCVAWGLGSLWPNRPSVRLVAVVAVAGGLAALAATSRAQVHYWRDTSTLFARVLEVEPNDPFAHEKMGQVLLRRGELEEAIRHLRRSLEVAPRNPFANLWLGLALGQTGDLSGATFHLQRAVELDPKLAEARFNLGVALAQQGKTEDAVAQYRQALRLEPRDHQARYNLALALISLGKDADARAALEELIRLDPDSPRAYLELGRLEAGEGDEEGARWYLQRARGLGSGSGEGTSPDSDPRRATTSPAGNP